MANETKRLQKVVLEFENNSNSLDQIHSFSKASKEFEHLVRSGVVSKRGNQQMSIDKTHLNNYAVNGRLSY